ncbi:5-hydroxytryptamine receptor 2B-like [Saccoglossus kowalevskii]
MDMVKMATYLATNVTSSSATGEPGNVYGVETVNVPFSISVSSVSLANFSNTTSNETVMGLPESANNWPALFLIVVILCTVLGNVLVCLAIMTDRKLQSITNYFLMSLAVADLMVSLLVMPFGIIVEFAGHWPYGAILCDMYTFFDVLCCTASIMHLCTISVDRYLAITSPIKHAQQYRHSSFRVVVKIALVWIISIGLSCPLIALGLTDEKNVLNDYTCALTNNEFKLYGSIVAFFIPLGIVIVTYSLTVHKLRKKAALCCDKPASSAVLRRYSFRRGSQSRLNRHFGVGGPTRYSYKRGSMSQGRGAATPSTSTCNSLPMKYLSQQNGNGIHKPKEVHRKTSNPLRGPIQGLVTPLRKSLSNASRTSAVSISNEQRATKVLGLVFFFFVICWAPFFILNVLTVLCTTCHLPVQIFDICLWFGYGASMINPILYTVFNKRFRAAFLATLTCNTREIRAREHAKCMWSGYTQNRDVTPPKSPRLSTRDDTVRSTKLKATL